ncbi:hypothetical protein DAPPUDRAFT_103579 [Daphnia pulex]|uniref:Uncharacterized protein n=1 Tax=Daphnia pulex TaxID=6669 RepID=E9GK45_DAPPU|nr:hypothetical protein DAPPUDRAFT_103579 [Daphnia pulex]|eukprot:EFX80121.1 hypothetical protein DAPPUDRAFT_103579 [Daphnia pulex]
MHRQQVIRNRNLRRLLNNLDEDSITTREFLISAENQFEFDDDNNRGNNARDFSYIVLKRFEESFKVKVNPVFEDDADTEVTIPHETTGNAHPAINIPGKNAQESGSEQDSTSESEEDIDRQYDADPDIMPKIADTLFKLAQVAIVSNNYYETAIEDLTACLEIRKVLDPEDSRLKGCSGEVASFYIPSFHESRATTLSPEDDRRNGLVLSAISQLLGNTDPNNVSKETRKFIAAGIASKDVERREMTRPSLREGSKGYLSYLSIVTMDVDEEDDSYTDSCWIESAEDVTDRAINIYQGKSETDTAAKENKGIKNIDAGIDDLRTCLKVLTTMRRADRRDPVNKNPSKWVPTLFGTSEGEIDELDIRLIEIHEKIAQTTEDEKKERQRSISSCRKNWLLDKPAIYF